MSRARSFAADAHGAQMYSDKPYLYHLDAVVGVLREFGFEDGPLIDAAYLHDVLEDTKVALYQIRHEFGLSVANIVYGVTDEPGKNRAERHAATYPKIAADQNRTIVKLADRIANVRECFLWNNPKRSMYTREYAGFYRALYRGGCPVVQKMWDELDRLHSGPEKTQVNL